MASWHPPIPAEAVYRSEVAALGAGLRLLLYFYNCVGRDGEFTLSLTQATESLAVEYETLRKWWQAIKKAEIVTVVKDMGHSGLRVQMKREWIDWHIHSSNFSTVAQREDFTVEGTLKDAQPSLNGSSTVPQREDFTVGSSSNKVLNNDQESVSWERASRAAPARKNRKQEKEHDPTLDHPAVITYRDTFRRWPNADQRQAIIMAVTHIELWAEVCVLWKRNRWDYLRVENLINRYQKGDSNGSKHLRPHLNGHSERGAITEADPERGF